LMVLLLAFFIVLVSLSQTQKAGFKAGIGEVKNAFGMAGGYGFFNFAFFGRTGGYAPNASESEEGDAGFDKELNKGSGGSGDTDLDVNSPEQPGYIGFKFNYEFPKGSDKPTPAMISELKKVGLGFSLFDSKIQIRSFCSESGETEKDRTLAFARSVQIMRALIDAGVKSSMLDCVAYSDKRYLPEPADIFKDVKQPRRPKAAAAELTALEGEDLSPQPKPEANTQGTFFFMFVKDLSKIKTSKAPLETQDASIPGPDPAKP